MTRTLTTLTILAALAAAACGGGEDDDLAPLREADAVQEVREGPGSGAVVVTVKPRTGPFAITEALEAVPSAVREATFRDGRAELVVDRTTREPRAAALALVALSRVRAPARRIAVEAPGFERRVRAEVDRPEQAAPLARELAALVGPAKLRGDAIRSIQVDRRGAGTLVRLELGGGAADERTIATLDAMERVAARDPELSAGPTGAELRVTARDVDDAGAAWDAAADALGDDATRGEVDLFVDREGVPILYGRAERSPRRAVALLRRLQEGGASGFARADLASVRVTIDAPTTNRRTVERAERAVRAADAAGARRVIAEWRVGDDLAWSGSVRPADRELTRLDDDPATVLRLLAGARRAHEAGIAAIQWEHPPSADTAKLAIAEPSSEPGERRFARAIRAVGWPGVAQLEVRVGPGRADEGCTDAVTVARLVSTSSGRARSVRAAFGCADEGLVEEFRDTWDDTADR